MANATLQPRGKGYDRRFPMPAPKADRTARLVAAKRAAAEATLCFLELVGMLGISFSIALLCVALFAR